MYKDVELLNFVFEFEELDVVYLLFVFNFVFEILDMVFEQLDVVYQLFVLILELGDSPESIDQRAVVVGWLWC